MLFTIIRLDELISNRFHSYDIYQENDVGQYGLPAEDPHGYLFDDFSYTC